MFAAYLETIIRRYTVVVLAGSSQDNRQSSKKNNKYRLLCTYGVPPDDGL